MSNILNEPFELNLLPDVGKPIKIVIVGNESKGRLKFLKKLITLGQLEELEDVQNSDSLSVLSKASNRIGLLTIPNKDYDSLLTCNKTLVFGTDHLGVLSAVTLANNVDYVIFKNMKDFDYRRLANLLCLSVRTIKIAEKRCNYLVYNCKLRTLQALIIKNLKEIELSVENSGATFVDGFEVVETPDETETRPSMFKTIYNYFTAK